MAVSSVGSVDSGPASDQPLGSNKLGKDEFMKILMAQLSNQDPTAPADSQAFVAQLAQFSSLELQQNTNSSLDSLLLAQTAGNQTSAVALVGKDVFYKGSSVALQKGQPATVLADVSAPASQMTVTLSDSTGKTVRTLRLGTQNAGRVSIPWDGKDDTGTLLPAGDYSAQITAAASDGTSIPVTQTLRGRVTGISFSNGVAQLLLGSQRVNMSDVLEVSESS